MVLGSAAPQQLSGQGPSQTTGEGPEKVKIKNVLLGAIDTKG